MRPGPDRTWLERLVGRLIPSRVPLSSRRTFAHEMGSTIFFTLAIAMIEGGVVAPVSANYWAMAFPLKLTAGSHRLLLRYSNPWISAGIALFLLWVGLFGFIVIRVRFGKRKYARA